MTEISAPYEAPENPDAEVTHENSVEESVEIIYQNIENQLRLKK